MPVGEGQGQHWMKATNWDNPEKLLELQMGYHCPVLFYDQACEIN